MDGIQILKLHDTVAITSTPLNFLSSQRLLSPPSKTHSLTIFRARNLRISCFQQTVQHDCETKHNTNLVKKGRKPRPSFLEQVQNKWSLKTPSLRENFPWQEQESDNANQEFQLQFSSDGSSKKESGKSSTLGDSISSQTKTKLSLAPWVHGNRSRLNPEGAKKCQEGVRQNARELDKLDEHPQIEEIDGGSERKCKESKSVSFVEDSSTTYQNVNSIKFSAEANGLKRLPWERKADEGFVKNDKLRKNNTTELAERLIPEHELKRLRSVSLRMVERMKVGAAGVTQALVDAIHKKWRNEEVVKLKFEGPPSKNMNRTHQILEIRTGGLVVWRLGGSIVLYRGLTYKLVCVKSYNEQADVAELESSQEGSPQSIKPKWLNGSAELSRLFNSTYFKNLSEEEQMDLSELNFMLDELGPRFIDWSGREPLPVDADLLPAVVPGYKTPFRLLPYGTRQALRDNEMTYLRRTARTLPPHFALGRSRELQGLALAMVKLWEKSAIAKIAIKRGVQNTSNERMAEELKILTAGTLLSRDREFIVFYRGNDFLPPRVTSALIEAEKRIIFQQDEEEQARYRASAMIDSKGKASKQPLVAGTLAETVAAMSCWGNQLNRSEMEKMMRDETIARHAVLVKTLQKKLALAKDKIRRAERTLQKVLQNQEPEDLPTDLETLTDEERFLFRKIGLSMKPYLLLGRREIFDGTIENMHLHWKYRELVKILVQRKSPAQVRHIALSLEAESGGVLVSVDKIIKGYVIIVYRGKNYLRPLAFRPITLLTKRQALARSIELQRREALKHHIRELEEKIDKLKDEQDELMSANGDADKI